MTPERKPAPRLVREVPMNHADPAQSRLLRLRELDFKGPQAGAVILLRESSRSVPRPTGSQPPWYSCQLHPVLFYP